MYGRFAVSPGATRLLQVVFQRPRHVPVNHQTDVRLVDPHPKGIGGRDHAEIADPEVLLDLTFVIGAEARMIPFSSNALLF